MQAFEITNVFMFTDAAFALLRDDAPSLQGVPGGVPTPLVGDFVRIPGHPPFTFHVTGREHEYVDSHRMTVTYVLDIVVGERVPPNLRRVK